MSKILTIRGTGFLTHRGIIMQARNPKEEDNRQSETRNQKPETRNLKILLNDELQAIIIKDQHIYF